MYNYAYQEGADMVISDIISFDQNGDQYEKQDPGVLNHMNVFGLMLRPEMHAALWNKLIRRSCYVDCGFHFIPRMLMEDQFACLNILSRPIKVAYLNKAFYHYNRMNNNSIVAKGISPDSRLLPLELIAKTADITPVQEYYDRAVFYIAYEATHLSKKKCPNFAELFRPHFAEIKRASHLFPFHCYLLIVLRLYGIRLS